VALVEFAPCGARRPGVSHPLDGALPRPTDWLQIVNQPQTEAEVAALRCCFNRGRPFGDPNWVTDTAERLGLNGRFGLVEDQRNNHKACHSYLYSPDLVAVTFRTVSFVNLVAVTFFFPRGMPSRSTYSPADGKKQT